MIKKITFVLLVVTVPFFNNSVTGQTVDSSNIEFKKCNQYFNENKLDSVLYSAKKMQGMIERKNGVSSERNAMAFNFVAECYRMTGNLLECYHNNRHSADLYEKIDTIKDEGIYAISLCRSGIIGAEIGFNHEAKKYLIKALEVTQKINSMEDYVQVSLTLANIYSNDGDYAKSEAMYITTQKILDTLTKTVTQKYLQMSLYNNKAVVYSQTGRYQKAISELEKSFNRTDTAGFTDPGQVMDKINIIINLAEMYVNSGKIGLAQVKITEARQQLQKLPYNVFSAGRLVKEEAAIYQHKNKLTEAIKLNCKYMQMMDTVARREQTDYNSTLVNLGILYIDTRQFHLADSIFKKNIQLLRQSGAGYSFELQQSLAGLSASLINQHRYLEALDTLKGLIELTFRAMDRNFEGMSELEKLNYRNALDEYFDLLYSCLYSSDKADTKQLTEIFEMQLRRKDLVLNSQVKVLNELRASHDSGLISIYNAWLNNRQLLAAQYAIPVEQRFINADSLETVTQNLEKTITVNGIKPGFLNKSVDIKKLFPKKPSPIAAIDFIRFNFKDKRYKNTARYAAFILKYGDTVPAFVHLSSESALMKLLKDKKGQWINEAQLTQKIYTPKSKGADILFRFIWKPMEIYLKGIKEINYSTASIFNNISFDAVYNGKEYLLTKYRLRRFSGLMDVEEKTKHFELPTVANLWADMDYGDIKPIGKRIFSSAASPKFIAAPRQSIKGTTALKKEVDTGLFQPFISQEIPRIGKIFLTNKILVASYKKQLATEDNFKLKADEMSGVLHISTHGFYLPYKKENVHSFAPVKFISNNLNPLFRCGLAFSGVNWYWKKGQPLTHRDDGILNGFEIAQLDLHKVKLVTLSACETGLGEVTDNEGNLGLQRAFKLAGVQNLLVSLWGVPAKQTTELMTLFYTNWLKGETLSGALHSAEYVMQKKYPPYFWAGFVLIE